MPRLTFDLATPDDDSGLRVLLRETPMGGAIEVAFLREPDFFAAAGTQGPFVQVLVARRGEQVAGVATRAIRPTYVNGELRQVGYLADLRLHPDFRGTTAVARGYRYLRELHDDGRTDLYSTVVVADNRAALATIAANRAGLPRYTDLGRVQTPVMYLRRRKPEIEADVVRGSRERLPAIVEKLNENRLQLAPAYREEDFLGGRFPGFRLEDFYLLRRGGRLAGVMGLWDQSSFRQTVVTGYRGWLGRLRPFVNLLRRPRLPDPGSRLRFFYLAFAATDDVDTYRALVRFIHNAYAGIGGFSHFTTALHEDDPRREVFDDYAATPFAGRLFAVTYGEPPLLDGRVPWVEAALL